jgi:GNAT superfamily N-acetyltransferase
MPGTDSTRPRRWSLSTLDEIEIVYTTPDRYGYEGRDPHEEFVQFFQGRVNGVAYPEDGRETRVPLGTIKFALLDLYEIEERSSLYEVLDSCSDEWRYYLALTDDSEADAAIGELASQLLIVESVEIVPEARGHGLGLHVLARVIRTWAGTVGVTVAMIAGTIEEVDEDQIEVGSMRRAIGEKLARYWQQLGFERLDPEVATSELPMLYTTAETLDFWERIEHYSQPFVSPSGDTTGE